MPKFELLSVVALTEDFPEENLVRGQVGTIVEFLTPTVFMVEFVDEHGRTYAMPSLPEDKLMRLHYHQLEQAA